MVVPEPSAGAHESDTVNIEPTPTTEEAVVVPGPPGRHPPAREPTYVDRIGHIPEKQWQLERVHQQ